MGVVAFDLYPRKCRVCGKKFEAGEHYAYKKEDGKHGGRYHWYCSWKCLRADENSKKK